MYIAYRYTFLESMLLHVTFVYVCTIAVNIEDQILLMVYQ